MSKRFLSILSFVLALFCALAAVAGEKPNFVFILADDLGYGDLSCYGQKKFTTPNIDRLGSEGLKFTQFYAGSTVCAPSRCSLLTGYHTGHAFIRGNKENPPLIGEFPIPPETITLAKKLKEAGYVNGAFGKWGLGTPPSSGAPCNQGFDEFFGYYSQWDAHNYYPPYLHHNETKIELDGKTYSHDLIEAEAIRFIRENKDRPFFCYLPVTIPHAAMQVPEAYVGPFRKQFSEFENTIGKYSWNTEVRNPVAAFPGMLSRLDETVRKVLELLQELGIDENTVVLFSSDNGPHKEGGHRSDFFESFGPLRGYKRDMTEGGIRVPLLVRWPGRIRPGGVSETLGAFWDILPTFCELAGTEPPPGIDGISLVSTFLGKPEEQKQHEYLYWEFYEQGGKVAARKGDWKAIRLNVNAEPNGPVELYNLKDDIRELNDLSNDHPERVREFEEIFRKAHTRSDVFHFDWE